MENKIYELVSKIRDRINNPIKQTRLIEDKEKWNRLCSSLDVTEDTQSAIEYYQETEFPNENGGEYLYIYGLLQAFFVQQDAVSNMHKALYDVELNYKNDYKKLFNLRELRNDIIGHPTDRNQGKSFHFISQITLTKDSFQIMSSYRNDIDKFRTVNVIEIIDHQKKDIINILEIITDKLDNDIKEFKEKYSMEKLHKHFKKNINYNFEKLYEITHGTNKISPMAGIGLKMITKLVNGVKKELIYRYGSLQSLPGIEDCYKEIDYLINYITKSYDGKIQFESMLIRFLIECLEKRVRELEDMCKEIDTEMSQ